MTPRLALGISIGWIPLAFLFDGITVLVLPVALAGERGEATLIGLISFVGLGVAMAVQPVAGRLGDRLRGSLDRRAFVALSALPALTGLWLVVGAPSVLVLAAGYVVLQLGASGMQAAVQAFIPEHVASERRGRASGLKTAFDVGGAFVAFLVLGAVVGSAGLVPAATVTTGVLIASLVLVVFLVPAPKAGPGPGPAGPLSAWSLPPGLVRLVIARFLFLLGIYGVGRFLLLLVGERLGINPTAAADEAGAVLALLTLATAVTAVPLGRLADRLGRDGLMLGGALVSAMGIVALLPDMGLAGLVAGGLLMSVGTAAFVTGNWASTTDLVRPADAGRLMGIANVGTGAAAACAGLFGPIIDAAGFAPALLVAAVAAFTAALPLVGPRAQAIVERA